MRSMHATVPAGAIMLAPALALLLGLAILGALDILRVEWGGARLAALLALALALGAALRLEVLARVAPLDLSLAIALRDDSSVVGWHLDAVAGLCLIALLIVGLTASSEAASTRPTRPAAVALL